VSFSPDTLAAMGRYFRDPVAFVREQLEVEPDEWQREALQLAATNLRLALKACKGPGKSTVLAWIILWFFATRPHANIIVLSITADNLKDNLWKEVAVWFARPKLAWLRKMADLTGERLAAKESPKTWWVSCRSFAQDARPDQQANTIAGLHSKHVMAVLDEVSDYPDGVLAAAEGIFSTAGQEAKLIVAGNPTRAEGPLYKICTKQRHRWQLVEITGDPDDPKRSPRIDLENARMQIEENGRDDPWVMVNILGLFPPVSEDKLLGPNDIQAAEARNVAEMDIYNEPVIYGLDVARYGLDSSKLRRRQGPVLFKGSTYKGLDGPTLAQRVAHQLHEDEKNFGQPADALFIDVTGVGSSAYDHLVLLGFGAIAFPIDFGGSADDAVKYADKRAEIYHRAARWVRKTGCLPSGSNDLGTQLCAPWFRYKIRGKKTCFILQPKEEMKEKGLPSPDDADAFALTFCSETIVKRDLFTPDSVKRTNKVRTEYDPYAAQNEAHP
jgi:hypothetical protein